MTCCVALTSNHLNLRCKELGFEMKRILLLVLVTMSLALVVNAQRYIDPDTVYTVHSISQRQFKELIADYHAVDWKMRSPRPVVVDFYADWCQPCKRLEPILRKIAQHYNGEVDFYRINVDKNSDIADVFQIRSIPFLLICPLQGEPKSIIGLYSQQEFIRVINLALGR